ncbi:MAG: GNAT family N-acetyltransferase [Anaerolineae bacterium]
MKITIIQAHIRHLEDCKEALLDSKLGQVYFTVEENAVATLTEGITKGEVFVALDEDGACLGFVWFIEEGAFHSFPYLHIIAVKAAHRGRGIGQQLIRFFEEAAFAQHSKVFLVVADFNPDARRLYERLGYRQVGAIPGLYRDDVTEYLMMKMNPAPKAANDSNPPGTLGDILETEFFGMCHERDDVPDSSALARALREQA